MWTDLFRDRIAWWSFGLFVAALAIAVALAPPDSTWDGTSGLTVVVITLAVAAVTGYFAVDAWRAGNIWGQGGAAWMAALGVFSGTLGIASTIGIFRAESTELTVVHTWGRAAPERVRDRYVRFAELPDPVHLDSEADFSAQPGDRVRCRIVDPPVLRKNVVACEPISGAARR